MRKERLPIVMTVEEAARLLRIGRNTAYAAARAGTIPTIRVGKRVLVPTARLLEMLGESASPPSDQPVQGARD